MERSTIVHCNIRHFTRVLPSNIKKDKDDQLQFDHVLPSFLNQTKKIVRDYIYKILTFL